MKEEPSSIDRLIQDAESYLKTRQELSTLIAAEKAASVSGGLFAAIVVFILFFFVFVFSSIALAYALSQYFGPPWSGFLTVAGLYLVLGILLHANRERWLKKPVMDSMIRNFFKNHRNE